MSTESGNLAPSQDQAAPRLYRGKWTPPDLGGSENLPNKNSGTIDTGLALQDGSYWLIETAGTLVDTVGGTLALPANVFLVLIGDNPPQLIADFVVIDSSPWSDKPAGTPALADKIPFTDDTDGDAHKVGTLDDVADAIVNDKALATQAWVTSQMSTYATQAYVDTAVSGLATTAYVDTAVLDMATQGWVTGEIATAVSGLATTAYVDGEVADLAAATDVTAEIAAAIAPLATQASVDAITADYVTASQIADFQTATEITNEITAALTGYATQAWVGAEITDNLDGYASEAYVDGEVSGLAVAADVTAEIAAAIAPLATQASVDVIAADYVTNAQLAAAIPADIATQSWVTTQIDNETINLVTVNQMLAAIAQIEEGLVFPDLDTAGDVTYEDWLAIGDNTSGLETKRARIEHVVQAGLKRTQVCRIWLEAALAADNGIVTDGSGTGNGTVLGNSDSFNLPSTSAEFQDDFTYKVFVNGVLANKKIEVGTTWQTVNQAHQSAHWFSDKEIRFAEDIPAKSLVEVHYEHSKSLIDDPPAPPSQAPVAADDFYQMAENTVLTTTSSVLDNDVDPDGDSLVVETTPIVAPRFGTLVLNANGTFTYTPFPTFVGVDTFVYRVTDGSQTDTATVEITVTGALQTSLAITTNDMPALCHITPTNTGNLGDIIGEKWTTNGTTLQENSGHILDLTDYAGTTIDVTYTATVQSYGGSYQKSTTIQVTVPSWANEWTLDDSIGAGGDNYTTWPSLITALKSKSGSTIVRVTPSTNDTYDVLNSEYDTLTSETQICIVGDGGNPRIDGEGSGGGSNRVLLKLDGCTQIVFKSLTFENTRDAAISVRNTTATGYIIHDNVTVLDAYGNGLECEANSVNDEYFEYKNCSISGTTDASVDFSRQGQGLFVRKGSKVGVYGGNYDNNTGASGDGVAIHPTSTGQVSDVIVQGVTSTNNARQGLLLFHLDGLDCIDNICSNNGASGIQVEGLTGDGQNIRVKRNTCTDNNYQTSEAGIWVKGNDNVLVEDNICSGNNSGLYLGDDCVGIVCRRNFASHNDGWNTQGGVFLTLRNNVQDIAIYNNTGDGNGNVDANTAGNAFNGSGVHYTDSSTNNANIRFKNNVVSSCVKNTNGANNARQIIFQDANTGVAEWDYNNYYNPNSLVYSVAFSSETFTQWKATTSHDANTDVDDPELDAAGKPAASSPLRNAAHRLTTVVSQAGPAVTVDDDVFFHEGDLIELNDEVAKITNIAANVLTLSKTIAASASDEITIYHPVDGKFVHKGAYSSGD